jgi:hypothetical protein
MLPGLSSVMMAITPPSFANITYQGSAGSSGNTYDYSFAGVSIGAAATDRIVAVVVNQRFNSATPAEAVTIGGVAATLIEHVNSGVGLDIWYAIVPTGTTATINVANGGTLRSQCFIRTFRVVSYNSPTPFWSDGVSDVVGTTATLTTGYSFEDGAVLGAALAATGNTWTWTGLNESYDAATEASDSRIGGAINNSLASTIKAISSGSTTIGFAGVYWR